LICVGVIIAGAAIGLLGWQLKVYMDRDTQNAADKRNLQSQLDSLNKQLSEARAASSTAASTTTPTTCSSQVAITNAVKNAISAAIMSKNYAAIQSLMASSVTVVYAASEKGGSEPPTSAVADLAYLNNATGAWNFSVAQATITQYQAGDYGQYFQGVIYVGQSADKYVVAFGFDMCGKISRIFVTPSSDLL
jgi:hypothetical protein